MNIDVIPLRAFNDNYVWTMRDGTSAAVVDPGDAQPVIDYLTREKLTLVAILNTHHHADHVGGNAALLEKWKVPVYGPRDDRIPQVTEQLGDGDTIRLPHFGIDFEVLEIPGHTRTHIAFVGGGMMFCGDTLFAAGCGRLFEGTPAQMHRSLSRLAAQPAATRVYCGHEYTLSNITFARAVEPGNRAIAEFGNTAQGQRDRDQPTLPTTLGLELQVNPFLRCGEPTVAASASARVGKAVTDPVEVLGIIREWKNSF